MDSSGFARGQIACAVAPDREGLIDWLIGSADALPQASGTSFEHGDIPPGWLSDAEYQVWSGLRFPKRRREWLLGRWAAKWLARDAVDGCRGLPPEAITVANDPDGAPYVSIRRTGRLPVSLSISHREARVFCAISSSDPAAVGLADGGSFFCTVGVDVERVERRDPAFVQDFFTPGEIRRVGQSAEPWRDVLITVMWSGKEALLKALRHGLRVDTRSVEVSCAAGLDDGRPVPNNFRDAWSDLVVTSSLTGTGRAVGACWAMEADYVYTLAAVAHMGPEAVEPSSMRLVSLPVVTRP
jgi:4'-phosphopantetheinyl transferase